MKRLKTEFVRTLARNVLPPGLAKYYRHKFGTSVSFDDSYDDWQSAVRASTGYESRLIAESALAAINSVRRGDAAYERDSVTFQKPSYSWPVLSGLMWAAATERGKLRVLDFGGSFGTTFFQNYNFLGTLPDLHWDVVEQQLFTQIGREHVVELGLTFYDSIDSAIQNSPPNVVHFGSSLQYLENPYKILESVSSSQARFLILDRLPMTNLDHDVLTVQIVPPSIYEASYPAWVFSENQLLGELRQNWTIMSTFDSLGGVALTKSGVRVKWRGVICSRDRI